MKKVLVSLDDLKDVISAALIDEYYEGWVGYESLVNEAQLQRWFDAQPDASPEGYDIVDAAEYEPGLFCEAPACIKIIRKGNVYRSRCHMRFILCEECYKEAFSKMETTGGENEKGID